MAIVPPQQRFFIYRKSIEKVACYLFSTPIKFPLLSYKVYTLISPPFVEPKVNVPFSLLSTVCCMEINCSKQLNNSFFHIFRSTHLRQLSYLYNTTVLKECHVYLYDVYFNLFIDLDYKLILLRSLLERVSSNIFSLVALEIW